MSPKVDSFTTKIKEIKFNCNWRTTNISSRSLGIDIPGPKVSSDDGKITWSLRLHSCRHLPRNDASVYLECNLDKFDGIANGLHDIKILNSGNDNIFCKAGKFQKIKAKKSITDVSLEKESNFHRLLVDDCLTISVSITFLEFETSSNHLPVYPDTAFGLSMDFEYLLDSEEISDVTICAGKRKFKVHRLVLAARSQVFKSMFSYNLKEAKSGMVIIPDVDPDVVEEMINFIYTGITSLLPESSEAAERETLLQLALGLLKAADKYQIQQLKEVSECFLSRALSVESAQDILAAADLHNSTQLRDRANDFIRSHSNRNLESSCDNGSLPKKSRQA